ncbi:MAG: transposase [Opitutales bacterium]|nr:transposase [Opitutales bacterium]
MGDKRLKSDEIAVYHVYTRIVHKRRLLADVQREVWVAALRRAARFSGVEVITYCAMQTHAHILVRVDPAARVCGDAELVARFGALYGRSRAAWCRLNARELAAVLAEGETPQANDLRERLRSRMGDISEFMRTLKQRYTKWFNRTYETAGTLWAERFGSVLVEDEPSIVALVAAYIDLNPVRAGLAALPEDYRWCGYAAAVAGEGELRASLAKCRPGDGGEAGGLARYRLLMLGKGSAVKRDGAGGRIDPAALERALASGGELETHELLRLRLRFMTRGRVLGRGEWLTEGGGARALGRMKKPAGVVPIEMVSGLPLATANARAARRAEAPG